MILVLVALTVAALLAAVVNWRHGLFLCIVAGFIQDPLRKITPGQPVVLVVFVAAVFGASIVGALIRGQRLDGSQLVRWFPALRAPMGCFAALVLLQSLSTLIRYQNFTLAGIGLLGYLSPLAAIIAFFQFNRSWADAHRWLRFYIAAAAVMASTIFLQFLGFSPRIFESIGLDTVYGIGGRIAMLCGIMRSSEVAAFHAGAAACLSLTLATIARTHRGQILYASLVPPFLLAIVLGGRRKMLAQFALYLLTFLFLLVRSRRAFSRATSLLSSLALVLVLTGVPLLLTDPGQSTLTPYLDRSASVFGEAVERLESMTVGSMSIVFSISGALGRGAGTTGQGSQYFGGSETIIDAPTEGGLARVLAELGLPGLFCLSWLAIGVLRIIRSVVSEARKLPTSQAALVYGLASFLPSHAVVFVTAHQVYGDPFVLLVLGALVGFAMSTRRITAIEARRAIHVAGTSRVQPTPGRRILPPVRQRATNPGPLR
jgi:hypothetical protein